MKSIGSWNIVIIVTNTIDGLPSLDDEHQRSKQLIEYEVYGSSKP